MACSLTSARSLSAAEQLLIVTLIVAFGTFAPTGSTSAGEPDDGNSQTVAIWGHAWQPRAPREEMRPDFGVISQPDKSPAALEIRSRSRVGLAGWWQAELPVQGGQTIRVSIERQVQQVEAPFRSAVARIDWLDDNDRRVPAERPFVKGVLEGWRDTQQPDFLNEQETTDDGWTVLGGTFAAPSRATKARVELHLRWDDEATVRYRALKWEVVEPVPPRKVKLATIHLRPKGGNPEANRKAFEQPIAAAADAGAQLIVLPETLTYYGTGKTPLEVSEPVPGPTSEFFGKVAAEHACHIVATCFEKDGPVLYNTALLLGPAGQLIGKYRKVCLPRGEIEAGITPGTEYPVFKTQLGRIGMMICYDGFFPQVAQRLTDAGAEIIAWPVWGCNPLLARARAAENQVVLISSTYEAPASNWMISAVYDATGQVAAQATEWGTHALAELDLSQPPYWPSLGTHRSERFHHQPAAP